MKIKTITLASLISTFALVLAVRAADLSVKISDVHLCCKSCVTGVEKAVAKVEGVKATCDRDAGTVTLTGSDADHVQNAVNALVTAGYFGASSDAKIKLMAKTGAKGAKVQTLKVEGVHLCCAKCVTSVDNAIKSVAGVKSHTAEKGAKSFEVSGDFNDKDVFGALQKAGLTGKIAK
jgi:copper chaperone CopZ